MSIATASRRLLSSSLVDILVGPHGVDRYLELIRPDITVKDARAVVTGVRRQTPRSVTITARANGAWSGFDAGQFVRVGVEIDGVRRTRTYSPACADIGNDRVLEFTVTTHPHGQVSSHLFASTRPGTVLHLGPAQGDFVLPEPRPQTLVLISGGSGVTPVMSMLRTLCAEAHSGDVVFLHYARTAADWLYAAEVRELAAQNPNVRAEFVATREGGEHISPDAVAKHLSAAAMANAYGAVCGPPALIDAVGDIWTEAQGSPKRVLAETFTPPTLALASGGAPATGTLRFLATDKAVPASEGTLLEQAEAAGLEPDFGCRMGICHTCTCRKAAGPVRNLLTGEISDEEDEDIQLCISVPAGDVALEI